METAAWMRKPVRPEPTLAQCPPSPGSRNCHGLPWWACSMHAGPPRLREERWRPACPPAHRVRKAETGTHATAHLHTHHRKAERGHSCCSSDSVPGLFLSPSISDLAGTQNLTSSKTEVAAIQAVRCPCQVKYLYLIKTYPRSQKCRSETQHWFIS